MNVGIFLRSAWPYVDGILKHRESIRHQIFPESCVLLALRRGFNRQIKKNYHPHILILIQAICFHNLHLRIIDGLPLTTKALCKRCRRNAACYHQWTPKISNLHIIDRNLQELLLDITSQRRRLPVTVYDFHHHLIHIRTIWLHDVIGQTICVIPVFMMVSLSAGISMTSCIIESDRYVLLLKHRVCLIILTDYIADIIDYHRYRIMFFYTIKRSDAQ